MPYYVYKCNQCGHKQEVDHPMMDTPTFICPKCSTVMAKLPGIGAVTFKGSGWGHQA